MKKTILFMSLIFLAPAAQTQIDGCDLNGKLMPIGAQILITDINTDKSHEMICAQATELHYVEGRAQIKSARPKWSIKVVTVEGDDCW